MAAISYWPRYVKYNMYLARYVLCGYRKWQTGSVSDILCVSNHTIDTQHKNGKGIY